MVEVDRLGPKNVTDTVHYVAKLEAINEEGYHTVRYLRNKAYTRDTFYLPDTVDREDVVRSRVLGVLTLNKGSTHRQSTTVKVFPALSNDYILK